MREPLHIDGLRCHYGALQVLDDVSLRVAPGELVAVLGPSGCGKTTLLRAVAGLVAPTTGRIAVGERVLSEGGRVAVSLRERRVGLVFQDYALFPDLSVRDNVGFAPGVPADRVQRLLGLAGVHELADRLPSALSGGQQQRVALARALAARPDVLLLDEPFANLDPPLRAELGPAVRRLVSAEQVATVLVTHDRGDALALADRVVVLVPGPTGGRVAQIAAPDVLFHEPATEAVARLVGSGWVLPGESAGGHVRTAVGDVPCDGCEGPIRLWVRPDQARFERIEGGPARCLACRFVGPGWEVRFSLDGLEGIATSPSRVPVGAGGGVVVRGAWPLTDIGAP